MSVDKKIITKIQKLLNLGANNPEEKEAKAALKKAAELAEEYGLALSDVNQETGEVSNIEEHGVKLTNQRYNSWAFPLASAVAQCFDCEPIISKWENRLFFVGTKTDLELCLWYYKSIRLRIIMMGKKKYKLVKDQKSYGYGAMLSVYGRLKEMFIAPREKMRNANTTALVVVKKEEVKKKVEEMHPHLRKSKRKAPKINGEAYNEGMIDGKKMNLHRGEVDNNSNKTIA